jgi:hypothetical protein
MLADTVTEVVYDVDGYTADDDTFEDGVVVDEPDMAETLVVPEDQVDENNNSSSTSMMNYIMYAVGGLVLLITFVGAVMYCKNKGN